MKVMLRKRNLELWIKNHALRIAGRGRRAAGFTLLEVMIAVGILGIGLVVVLQGHVMNLKMIAHSELSTKATLLAEKRIVEIEGKKLNIIGEREGSFEESPEFYWKELITPVRIGNKELSGLSRVEVIVSWEEGSREEEVRLVTYTIQQSDMPVVFP